MESKSDNEIIKRIIDGQEEGLNLLIDKYGKLIYAILHEKLLKIKLINDIEDVFYTIIYKLWNSTSSFNENRGNYKNFIVTITKYTAIDYLRSNKLDAISFEEYMIHAIEEKEGLNCVIELDAFNDLIENLKPLDKEIFTKRYYFDESITSIARDIKRTNEYVNNRLSKGRKKLLKLFGGANNYGREL